MEEENMESKKPLLVVFAGPNGSGKSTIVEHFGLLEGYTNADDVVYSTEMTNYEAAQYVYERRNKYLSELKNFSFETVLSSDYSMDIIRKAHEKGYFIKCIFVLTKSPGLNAYRIRARVEQGGHDVPEEKIYDRYDRSLDNIKELVQICDILHIYDNTGKEPERIFRKHKEEDYKIFPNDSWNQEEILELIS